MSHSKINVYIAEDHALVRKGMIKILQTFPRIKEIRDFENGKDLIKAIVKGSEPDVVLLDLEMPVMDGYATSDYLLSHHPNIKLIILTVYDNEEIIIRLMEKGVHGYLLKKSEPHEVEQAIYSVFDRDFYQNEMVVRALRKSLQSKNKSFSQIPSINLLSDRELDVLKLICNELSAKEIGEKLFISEKTVHTHRLNIIEKLGVKGTVGLVRFAYDHGLVAITKL